MLTDPAYNAQMGAAELGDVIEDYRGSYIMAFAAYNAGRGRVKKWIERYGDPRDPKVDPIDWVERIPFSETRNYVQRVMENMQVYRARFGGGSRLLIEADLRRGAEHRIAGRNVRSLSSSQAPGSPALSDSLEQNWVRFVKIEFRRCGAFPALRKSRFVQSELACRGGVNSQPLAPLPLGVSTKTCPILAGHQKEQPAK